MFWKPALAAGTIRASYLPFSPLRPFDRRGMVSVDLQFGAHKGAVLATQIGTERDRRIREWRYLRSALRKTNGSALVFAALPASRIGLTDLGFVRVGCRGVDDECIFARGFDIEEAAEDAAAHRGIGTAKLAQLRPIETV